MTEAEKAPVILMAGQGRPRKSRPDIRLVARPPLPR